MKSLFDIIEATNASLVDDYERRAQGEIVSSNYSCGIASVDDSGFGERGVLSIIQAQAGEGKSTWARQLIYGAVNHAGLEPIFYPFEDPEYQIGVSYTAKELGVSGWDLKRGSAPGSVIKNITSATNNLQWTEKCAVVPEKIHHVEMLKQLDSSMAANPRRRYAIVDYLQAFDAEDDEKSVERVVARVTWGLSEIAKKYNATVVAFSQVKPEVRARGKAIFDGYMRNAQFKGEKMEPGEHLVIGFRPNKGDGMWSSALYHYAKDIRSWWRPNHWLKEMGFQSVRDNYGLFEPTKTNFLPADMKAVKLGWGNQGVTEWKTK